MALKLIWSEEALEDIESITLYIEKTLQSMPKL